MAISITIHKYTLEAAFGVEQELDMPKGAIILACTAQHDQPRIWAAVDLGAPAEIRTFVIIGTGEDASAVIEREEWGWTGVSGLALKAMHRGTVPVHNGGLVLHVFEKVADDV